MKLENPVVKWGAWATAILTALGIVSWLGNVGANVLEVKNNARSAVEVNKAQAQELREHDVVINNINTNISTIKTDMNWVKDTLKDMVRKDNR